MQLPSTPAQMGFRVAVGIGCSANCVSGFDGGLFDLSRGIRGIRGKWSICFVHVHFVRVIGHRCIYLELFGSVDSNYPVLDI